ncbi:transcription antitermination factor NusB [Candidatus Wolfebacteria bacterium]|nr:transcription antitermination factor NusB [Candidatus Wolfebacteria bacterium]
MANRHLSRSVVLQTLFEHDFSGTDVATISDALHRNAEEFAPGMGDFVFMEKLLRGVLEKQGDIDTIMTKAAPDWPLEKISVVDRNVLRIGLYELLFADRNEVPAKVAINEAIELAKTYGGESSGKFVNGVLGSVYKELGEPGKDETSKKPKDIPFERMPIEKLAGAVVYAKKNGNVYLALVHDVFGHWTLSKGGVGEGEDVKMGTMRAIKEELGLDIAVGDELGNNEYVASHPEKGKIRKQVSYFLAEAPYQDLKLGSTGGLDDAKWFKLSEVVSLNAYDDILPIITKAVHLLLKK